MKTGKLIFALAAIAASMWVLFVMLEDDIPLECRMDLIAVVVGLPLLVALMVVLDLVVEWMREAVSGDRIVAQADGLIANGDEGGYHNEE